MPTLMVGYDLNRPGQSYAELYKQLEATGTYWHELDSTWLVVTDETPEQLVHRLRPHLDSNDELLVIDVSGDPAAWIGLPDAASDWLSELL